MNRNRNANRRSGAVLALALLVLVIAAAIALGLVQLLVARHRVQAMHERHLQVVELARGGIDRGVAKLAHSPDYAGETWTVPKDVLNGKIDAAVEITVERVADNESLRQITARAVWGEGESRVQHTRTLVVQPELLAKE